MAGKDVRLRIDRETWRKLNARRQSTEDSAGDVIARLLEQIEEPYQEVTPK